MIDVTGPSLEVMFEFGFAGNMTSFLPVVRRQEDRERLPAWLTAFQVPAFEEMGARLLAVDVVTALRTASKACYVSATFSGPGHDHMVAEP